MFLRKHVAQPPTTFYLNYLNYTKYDNPADTMTSEFGVDCGWIQYRITDLVMNQDAFDDKIILISQSNSTLFNNDIQGIQFNFFPVSDIYIPNDYYLGIELQLSVYGNDTSDWIVRPIVTIDINVLPCWTDDFRGKSNIPENFTVYLYSDPIKFSWDEFKQIPECNYTTSYTFTMVELNFEDDTVVIPQLKDLVEGTVEVPGVVNVDF